MTMLFSYNLSTNKSPNFNSQLPYSHVEVQEFVSKGYNKFQLLIGVGGLVKWNSRKIIYRKNIIYDNFF